jgi:NADP-dependent 3-hydroxy acid dehydrogenase YdfG
MRGLTGKVAVVAGAAPGSIGGATAVRLAEEGMAIGAADLDESAVRAVVDEIRALDGRAYARPFDITDESSCHDLVDFTAQQFGGLDALFNVAADLSAQNIGRDSTVMSVPLEVWRRTIDVTLTGYIYGIRHALPLLIERGGGSTVNTSSSSVWLGEAAHVAYQAAKSGLTGLTRHTHRWGQTWRALQSPGTRNRFDEDRSQGDHRRVPCAGAGLGAVPPPRCPGGHRGDGGVLVLGRRRVRQWPDDPRRRRRQPDVSAARRHSHRVGPAT